MSARLVVFVVVHGVALARLVHWTEVGILVIALAQLCDAEGNVDDTHGPRIDVHNDILDALHTASAQPRRDLMVHHAVMMWHIV